MQRIAFYFAALLGGLTLLTGCQTAASKVINLTEADNGRAVRVAKHEPIQIVLEGDYMTGNTWDLVDWDAKVIVMKGPPQFVPGNPTSGESGKFTFNFTTIAGGQTNLRIVYVREKERTAPPMKTFAIIVTVD